MSEPSTEWKEDIAPGEAEVHAQHLVAFEEMRRLKDAKYGKGRQLHRFPRLGLRGQFEVLSDLPDHAQHGLFAAPASYEVWVRLSNGGVDRVSDRRPDFRGFAIKVRGVEGPGALGHGDTDCQDFLLIQQPALGFVNSREFVDLVLNTARGPVTLLRHMVSQHGLGGAFRKLKEIADALNIPFSGFATAKFFSAAPIACGPYAVRVRMLPARTIARPGAKNDWAKDFLAHLSEGPLRFELQLQFYVDEARTPIEDASGAWPEDAAPFVTVGVLTIPAQDPQSEEGKALTETIEAASFDPWAALMAHRPLGEVMRARKVVYFQSQTGRRET